MRSSILPSVKGYLIIIVQILLRAFRRLFTIQTRLMYPLEVLSSFAPYGEGNSPVTVAITDFKVVPQRGLYKNLVGTDGIKMFGSTATAIGFGMAERMAEVEKPEELALTGTLSYNYFQGNKSPQIEFTDYKVLKEIGGSNNTPFFDILATMAAMRS